MKIYPKNIDQTIGFDQIKKLLADETHTHYASQKIQFLKPSDNPHIVLNLLNQTREMCQLLTHMSFPDLHLIDELKNDLSTTTTEGQIPNIDFLAKLKNLLADTALFFDSFANFNNAFPKLKEITDEANLPIELFEFLDQILDQEGKINPHASPALKQLSDLILAKEKEVRKMLHNRFEIAKKNEWAGDTEITIRNERLVIPIIAEFKKKVKGLVHDSSASGKYLYIEPIECFDENNKLKELYLDKKKEIERILRKAATLLSKGLPQINSVIQLWENIDFIASKAKLHNKLQCNFPEITDQPSVLLKHAYHPLLYLQIGDKVVRNTISLNKNISILLISGPNAGGKSILLKQLMLLQFMFQCGIGITAEKGSMMYVFKELFADISDSQSIQNALSTYSAHLVHMKYIMANASPHTLLALDELGSGTDPDLGAPIAEAMLEDICNAGALGLVSTHLGKLKKLPAEINQLENASMRYDPYELKPTFLLDVGKPGSSFAFELAQNLALPANMILKAKEKRANDAAFDYEHQMLLLEKRNHELEHIIKQMKTKEKHLEQLTKSYHELKANLEKNQQTILKQTKEKVVASLQEADLLLKKIKKEQKNTKIINIDEWKSEVVKVSEATNKNIVIKEDKQEDVVETKYQVIPNAVLQVGDQVVVHKTDQVGEIISISNKQAVVALGELHSRIPLVKLTKIKGNKPKKHKKGSNYISQIQERQLNYNQTLDLRGQRGDVALIKTEQYLDEAYMLGQKQVKIIHGRGDGILKQLLKDFLKKHHAVQSWSFETIEQGGDGATIIQMKS